MRPDAPLESSPAAAPPTAARRGGVRPRIASAAVAATGRLLVLALVLAPALATPAAAAPGPPTIPNPPVSLQNAATWYARAINAYDAMIDPATRKATGSRRVIETWEETGGPPTPAIRRAFRDLDDVLDDLRRGASCRFCDWNLDRTQGVELLLPHLGALRRAARLLALEVDLHVADGNGRRAAKNVDALYRMSAHVTEDDVLISTLVGMAIFSYADERAERGFDAGVFGPAEAGVMRRGIRAADGGDPFRSAEAVASEQSIFGDWLYERYRDAEDRATVDPMLLGDPALIDPVRAMTDAEFDDAFAQYDAAMDEAVEIFMLDDDAEAMQRMEAFERGLEEDPDRFGPIARLFMPSLTRVLETRQRIEGTREARLDMLEEILAGEDPVRRMNAAILYQEAASRLETYSRARLEAFFADGRTDEEREAGATGATPSAETADADPGDAPPLDAMLVTDVVDLVRAANELERCDFSQLRIADRGMFSPRFLPPMRDLARFLLADASRADRDPGVAARRLAAVLRFAGRLGDEPRVMASLIAQDAFDRAVARAIALRARGLDDASVVVLHEAIEGLGRADPFGFIASVLEVRDDVAGHLEWRWQQQHAGLAPRSEAGEPPPPATVEERRAQAERRAERVRGWSAERLLAIAVALEWSDRRVMLERATSAEGEMPVHLLPSLEPVADLLDLAALAAVRSEVDRWEDAIRSADFDALERLPAPAIADVTDRIRRTRRDVAEARAALRPATQDAASEVDGDEASDEPHDVPPAMSG